VKLDPSLFYDRDYEHVLNSMVAVTLQREAPIYEDVLIERIARAHGFQRSGGQDPEGKFQNRGKKISKDPGRWAKHNLA
jgi:hypothetical protein